MTLADTYQLVVLLGAFLLLTVLAMRGRSIFVAAPLAAVAALAFSGADPVAGMTGSFMQGFADYLQKFFLIFALGAAFGKLMEQSGAARSIAAAVMRGLGPRWALLAVVLSCAVMTYGGVSLFVVGFSVYPLAVQLFREADLPRRLIPGAIAFGSVTFTMTTAGSPEIQNLIPIDYLVDAETKTPLTDARAGWPASLIVAGAMFALGQLYLQWELRRSRRRGERFQPRSSDAALAGSEGTAGDGDRVARPLPGVAASLAPLLVTLLSLNLLPWLVPAAGEAANAALGAGRAADLVRLLVDRFPEHNALATLSVLLGVVTALVVFARRLPSPWEALSSGFVNGLIAIGATCSVVGFGEAIKELPAFQNVVAWVTRIPGDPLIGAAVAVAVIAGLAGSASGGQVIALRIIKPLFIDELGVAPRALHRVVSIASGSLDTLPANGYVVMLIRNICGETHREAYWPVCVTCTIVPAIGTALAIALFKLFPAWQWM